MLTEDFGAILDQSSIPNNWRVQTDPLDAQAVRIQGIELSGEVSVYQHDNFGGFCDSTSQDWSYIGNAWNDKISSIVVNSGTWQFFENRDYGGRSIILSRGSYPSLGPFGFKNLISSFKCLSRSIEDISEKAILTKRISIRFGSNGEGTMNCQGLGQYACLGRPGLSYTRDLIVRGVIGEDKFPRKFSNEFQVWMYWAVLIMGNRGIYIHEGPATLEENGGPTQGCIHLGTGDAEEVYNWIDGRTRVTIEYPWNFRL